MASLYLHGTERLLVEGFFCVVFVGFILGLFLNWLTVQSTKKYEKGVKTEQEKNIGKLIDENARLRATQWKRR